MRFLHSRARQILRGLSTRNVLMIVKQVHGKQCFCRSATTQSRALANGELSFDTNLEVLGQLAKLVARPSAFAFFNLTILIGKF